MNRPPLRGRSWQASDRTGGPLDRVLDLLRGQAPNLIVERLHQTHPGDDDNVYFIGDAVGLDRIQVDTAPDGGPPFVIEAAQRLETRDPVHAAAIIHAWLSLAGGSGAMRAAVGTPVAGSCRESQ